MLLRELTEKLEKFAAARAMGKSWADAYREAYEPSNPNAASVYTRAHRTRRNPLVVQRIAELRTQLKPPDMSALRHRALAVGIELAETAKDEKKRLEAAQWVAAELENSRKLEEEAWKLVEAKKPAEDPAEIIAELRRLYARALAAKTEGRIPGVADGDVAASGAELLDQIRPAAAEVPEQPPPQVRYIEKCISKPGHFPPRFVRIAVQISPPPDAI